MYCTLNEQHNNYYDKINMKDNFHTASYSIDYNMCKDIVGITSRPILGMKKGWQPIRNFEILDVTFIHLRWDFFSLSEVSVDSDVVTLQTSYLYS